MKREFCVGDVVRIRDWDDMKKEFGRMINGWINCPVLPFTDEMRSICGLTFQITEIDGYIIEGHDTGWVISSQMIELVNEDEYDEFAESEELNNFLNEIYVVDKTCRSCIFIHKKRGQHRCICVTSKNYGGFMRLRDCCDHWFKK